MDPRAEAVASARGFLLEGCDLFPNGPLPDKPKESKVKPIKMLGLAALAALPAMAFAGATSAMAEPTSLCKKDMSVTENEVEELEPIGCPEGSEITHVHEATLEGAQAVLKTSLLTIKCDVLFLGDAFEGSSEPLEIEGNFTYTNCGGCTVEEVSAHSLITVLRLGHELGDVEGEGEVLAECTGLHCVYKAQGLRAHALGPLLSSETNGGVSLAEQILPKVSGTFCPKESKLTISTTPLEKTYLTNGVPLKMVCLKVGPNRGLYLSVGDGVTCEVDDNEPEGEYELAWVLSSIGSKKHACGWVGSNRGRFLSFGNEVTCEKEDATRKGQFELGETP